MLLFPLWNTNFIVLISIVCAHSLIYTSFFIFIHNFAECRAEETVLDLPLYCIIMSLYCFLLPMSFFLCFQSFLNFLLMYMCLCLKDHSCHEGLCLLALKECNQYRILKGLLPKGTARGDSPMNPSFR